MNEGIVKWKLGWSVFLRAFLLYFVLAVLSILLLPARALWEFSSSWPSWVRTPAILLGFIFALYVFPMIFYWTARITGHLQGSDKSEFARIKDIERERNEYGEKDPWEIENPTGSGPDERGHSE